jgi:hypothetical protein
MLVLTSRYREETALRALRYFASFALTYLSFSSGFLLRKARGVGVVSKEGRPYKFIVTLLTKCYEDGCSEIRNTTRQEHCCWFGEIDKSRLARSALPLVLKLPRADTRDPRSAAVGLKQRARSNNSLMREASAAPALTNVPLGRIDPTEVVISGAQPSDESKTSFNS